MRRSSSKLLPESGFAHSLVWTQKNVLLLLFYLLPRTAILSFPLCSFSLNVARMSQLHMTKNSKNNDTDNDIDNDNDNDNGVQSSRIYVPSSPAFPSSSRAVVSSCVSAIRCALNSSGKEDGITRGGRLGIELVRPISSYSEHRDTGILDLYRDERLRFIGRLTSCRPEIFRLHTDRAGWLPLPSRCRSALPFSAAL